MPVASERDHGWNDNRRHDQGFWPGEVTAGVVGGAIGTAGAIATAPFRVGSYARDNGYRRGQSYAARSSLVCTPPGTRFRDEDGRRLSASDRENGGFEEKAARRPPLIMELTPARSRRSGAITL